MSCGFCLFVVVLSVLSLSRLSPWRGFLPREPPLALHRFVFIFPYVVVGSTLPTPRSTPAWFCASCCHFDGCFCFFVVFAIGLPVKLRSTRRQTSAPKRLSETSTNWSRKKQQLRAPNDFSSRKIRKGLEKCDVYTQLLFRVCSFLARSFKLRFGPSSPLASVTWKVWPFLLTGVSHFSSTSIHVSKMRIQTCTYPLAIECCAYPLVMFWYGNAKSKPSTNRRRVFS